MNREKWASIIVAIIVISGYFFIISFDFGPVPRSQRQVSDELQPPDFSTASRLEIEKVDPVEEAKQQRVELKSSKPLTDEENYNTAKSFVLAKQDHGRWVVAGDVLIDPDTLQAGTEEDGFAIAKFPDIQFWDKNQIPVKLDVTERRNRVTKALRTFSQFTPVQFTEHTDETDYIHIRSVDHDVCQSYLGKKGGEQEILLHSSCTSGQIIHELLHALGFVHEQSRADRDEYIQLHWDNMLVAQKNQFQKLEKHLSQPAEYPFDFYSVLLYPPHAFSKNNSPTITKLDGTIYQTNRSYLSRGDIQKVMSIYGAEVN